MIEMQIFYSRDEWLKFRKSKIGGSDCASILGLNPWKSNLELYREKIGETVPEDISDKPIVKYGNDAEPLLRQLFALDFPQYEVLYKENNVWTNTEYPFAHASLDGWLIDKTTGRKGIFECKTSTISSAAQKEKWKDKIPDNYYCQVLHYFLVTGFDFAILKAQLKHEINGELYITTKHYKFERADVIDDIEILKNAEIEFSKAIETREQPPLLLPNI